MLRAFSRSTGARCLASSPSKKHSCNAILMGWCVLLYYSYQRLRACASMTAMLLAVMHYQSS